MGVTSLWNILEPSARPVKLEALSRRKLAVDASIWIYQFLKAVRDSDGNSLPQSHIVGFFRRICKLLYFGIYPVFVFDGGAPVLKRKTIQARRERRDEKRQSTEEMAQKILAVQLQRQYGDKQRVTGEQGDEEAAYLEDLPNLHPSQGQPSSRSDNSVFRKKDEYHLPTIEEFRVSTGDSRIIPTEEFENYGEDLNYVDGIDINTIDPKSPQFEQLPLSTQYMILWHLRLKSRLRMGFSKNQLETLFPSSMEFSKFQIQQVQKRNFYTQRLMDVSGMSEHGNITKRIAGEKDRKYALAKNDDGWTLSLGGDDTLDKPILIEDERDIYENDLEERIAFQSSPKLDRQLNVNSAHKEIEQEADDDDDDDWVDVATQSRNEKDNNDDDELQRALVESIYSKQQYDDKQNISDEDDLKLAIQKSKADLIDLQLKEQQLSQGNIVNWGNIEDQKVSESHKEDIGVAEFDNVNLGSSFLFGKPLETNSETSTTSKVAKDQGTVSNKKASNTRAIETKVVDIKTPEEKSKKSVDKNGAISLGNFKSEPQKVAPTSKTEDTKNNISNELEVIFDEGDQAIANEDSKSDDTSKNEKKMNNELPVWFEENVSGNKDVHGFVESSGQLIESTPPLDGNFQEDKNAGLISWSEAKDMMQDSDADSDDFEDIEEVEVVRDVPAPEILEENQKMEERKDKGENSLPEKSTRVAEVIDYDFEEEEEEKLVKQLRSEAVEHEDFTQQLKRKSDVPTTMSKSSISEDQLMNERMQRDKRDADEVTDGMISDVQELLRRFGIPFITAPMEAEAQCAELLRLNLVDGIVTDDSDCFLFGGDKVYRNMFNQKQFVECYMTGNIESSLGIGRKQLIEFALLLGSDYTEGIKGIGPVLAVEILAEFGSLENLKAWFDDHTKKIAEKDENMTSLKKLLLNRIKNAKLFLPDSFPDKVVFDAYQKPEVDSDETEFKWGVPNLDLIRTFLMSTVGWSQAKVDEVLVPLIRDINKKKQEGTQSTIGEFFPQSYKEIHSSVSMSKRMKAATTKLNKRTKRS